MIPQPTTTPTQYPNLSIQNLTLTLTTHDDNTPIKKYHNRQKALLCLKEGIALSSTPSGCQKMYQISPYWIDSLFEAIQVKLIGADADVLHFKLIINLLGCQMFHPAAMKYKSVVDGYRNYAYSVNFQKQCNIVADMLDQIAKNTIKKQQQKLKSQPKYLTQFQSKQHAASYLQQQPNWCSFVYNNVLFQHNYKNYIQMLIGAAKAGALKQVVLRYPDCFGCAVYNIVKWSLNCQEKNKQIQLMGLLFGTKHTGKMRVYYAEVEKIVRVNSRDKGWSLSDRNRILCIDLKRNGDIFNNLHLLFQKGLLKDQYLPDSIFVYEHKGKILEYISQIKKQQAEKQKQEKQEEKKVEEKQDQVKDNQHTQPRQQNQEKNEEQS